MAAKHPRPEDPLQRVQVELVSHWNRKRIRIRLESHDENLGWHTSGSLSLPLHQLPLLEQAIAEMRDQGLTEEAPESKIIYFPRPHSKTSRAGAEAKNDLAPEATKGTR